VEVRGIFLVIDDEEDQRDLYEEYLRQEFPNYVAYAVGTTRAAELIVANFEVDLIICDGVLSNSNAKVWLERFVIDHPHQLAILASGTEESRVVPCLKKPFQFSELFKLIENLLATKARRF
jgi:DNA-binding NtrC family response regulator